MRIDVLTLFPEMFSGVFSASILGKAQDKGIVELNTVNFREFSRSKHGKVDDAPYGGGGGMVLMPEPLFDAVEFLTGVQEGGEGPLPRDDEQAVQSSKPPRIVLMCPQGEPFSQRKAEELSQEEHLIFVCGHYEGYDERIREHLVTDELSIGDYVLTGGELPAMVVIDAVTRLLPGVLGNEMSAITDSFSTGLLEYPQYTRPVVFRDWEVPDILLSGHHVNVATWRRKMSFLRTLTRRPDMLEGRELTKEERQWQQEHELEKVKPLS